MNPNTKQTLAVLGLLTVTAIWGSTFILVKWTVAQMDVYYFLFLRFLAASIFMVVIFPGQFKKIDLATVKAALVLGALMCVAFIAQTEGLRFTTASNSAMITGLYMVFIPFCLFIYPVEKPLLFSLAGILLALPGMFLLTRYGFNGINKGDIVTLVAAFAFAWQIIFTGVYSKRHSIVPLVVIQFVLITVVCGVITLAKGSETTSISPIAWTTIIVTAVFATGLALSVQVAAQRVIDPTRAGIIFAMEAVFGALFGWWLGGEAMTPAAFAGACLMVGGMAISEIHPLAKMLMAKAGF